MMSVQVNGVINKQIKSYKKWLEKAELFTYEFRHLDNSYYKVRYSKYRSSQPTGFLIMTSDGGIIPFEEAKFVLKQFDRYNSCILGAAEKLSNYKEIPVKIFDELQEYLRIIKEIGPHLEKDIIKALNLGKDYIFQKKRFDEIYQELKEIDYTVQQKRGYLTLNEVEKVYILLSEYNKSLYHSLRESRETISSFSALYQFCQKNQQKIIKINSFAFKRLDHILEALTRKSNIDTLHETLREFEQDENGNQISFTVGEKGLQEYVEKLNKRGNKQFEQNLIPLIRNL